MCVIKLCNVDFLMYLKFLVFKFCDRKCSKGVLLLVIRIFIVVMILVV